MKDTIRKFFKDHWFKVLSSALVLAYLITIFIKPAVSIPGAAAIVFFETIACLIVYDKEEKYYGAKFYLALIIIVILVTFSVFRYTVFKDNSEDALFDQYLEGYKDGKYEEHEKAYEEGFSEGYTYACEEYDIEY